MSKLNVGLLGGYFGWAGGAEFLRNIANGLLSKKESHHLKLYLLLPVANHVAAPLDKLRMLKRSVKGSIHRRRLWIARPTPQYHDSMLDYFGHVQGGEVEVVYYDSNKAGLIRCLNHIKADIALPVNGSLGRDFQFPWLGYVADFQHKHLPNNFDPMECFNREIHFATTLRDAKALIVNSMAVKEDVCHFYPWIDGNKVFNLPFTPHPLDGWLDPVDREVIDGYKLPRKYFLISNQFWIHKDHLTAFRALKRIADVSDVSLVCTGNLDDYRRPGYVEEIKGFLHKSALVERVQLLGHVPKRDQIEIMKGSLGVIQPTLFEGGPGGGCTYDAVSLGVPVILSDLPVNKEVVAEHVWFFNAGNDANLAEKMLEVIGAGTQRPSREMLLRRGQANLSILGDRLLEAIECSKRA